ncbi:MAG: acyl carrier protein [Bacillota bacterium]
MENNKYQEILEKLNEIAKENINLNKDLEIDENLSAYINNSIDFIKIVVAIETEYNIEFTDEELETDNFQTVRNLIDFIINKL